MKTYQFLEKKLDNEFTTNMHMDLLYLQLQLR
jgi:hypothetical protein